MLCIVYCGIESTHTRKKPLKTIFTALQFLSVKSIKYIGDTPITIMLFYLTLSAREFLTFNLRSARVFASCITEVLHSNDCITFFKLKILLFDSKTYLAY